MSNVEILVAAFQVYGVTNKRRLHPLRQVVNAIFYLVHNGVKWRELPTDFPPWKTVYGNFRKGSHLGLWQAIHGLMCRFCPMSEGQAPDPSLLMMATRTMQTRIQHGIFWRQGGLFQLAEI